jgi:hypothetical protein
MFKFFKVTSQLEIKKHYPYPINAFAEFSLYIATCLWAIQQNSAIRATTNSQLSNNVIIQRYMSHRNIKDFALRRVLPSGFMPEGGSAWRFGRHNGNYAGNQGFHPKSRHFENKAKMA